MASCSNYGRELQLRLEIVKTLSLNNVGVISFKLQLNHMMKKWELILIHTCGFEYKLANYSEYLLLLTLNKYLNPELED